MNETLQKSLNYISDILFPGNCPICDNEPYKDGLSYMCRECEDLLPWIYKNGCKYCGIPMSGFDFDGLICSACRKDPPVFLKGKCMFLLDQNAKKIIHEIKYCGVKDVLKDMPRWLERIPRYQEFLKNSILIPVPLHKKRFKKRGFNQSVWIANALKKELKNQIRISHSLSRVKNTPSQTSLTKKERITNVKNAFALKQRNCFSKQDKIILIDDVYTTGATLDACAKVLIDEGFQNVFVATLGHG